MVDIENQVHLECIICKDTAGILKSRNEFFQGCTCQQVVFHDKCWNEFMNSEYGESCPTCRKAFNIHLRSFLRPVVLQPQFIRGYEEQHRVRIEQNEYHGRHEQQEVRNQDEESNSSCFRKSFEFCLFFMHACINVFCVLSLTSESTDLQIQCILFIQTVYSTYNCISSFLDFCCNPPNVSTILDAIHNIEQRFILISHTIPYPASFCLRCMCSWTSCWSLLASGRLALYIVMLMFLKEVSSFKFAYIAFIIQIGEISFYISFAIACSVIVCCLRCYDILLRQE